MTDGNTFLDNRVLRECQMKLNNSKPTFTWYLDEKQLIDGAIISGAWEWHTTWAIEKLVKPGMHVLDIGANMGYYSVLMGHLVGPSGWVSAFEPMEEPYCLTRKHCALNSIEHVNVFQIALSNEDAPVKETKLFNYSWPPDRCVQHPSTFVVAKLDSFFSELHAHDRLDFIKLDVDGYEFRVLRGAEHTLLTYKPRMLLEVVDYTLRDTEQLNGPNYIYGSQVKSMLEYMQSLGYMFFREESFQQMTDIDGLLTSLDFSKTGINLVCSTTYL